MNFTKFAYRATIALIWALALWHSWACRGLFVDGSGFLIQIVRREWFFDFYPPRLFAMVVAQVPIMIGIHAGSTDLHLLAMLLSFGLFGLLPILGNLMSNTLIVSVGFTLSPNTALASLIFLVVIHKLEYFLNSKIIGHRIQNPMWLTLLGLVLGERLMGVPGMILAPVVFHYIKVEASQTRVVGSTPASSDSSHG